MNATTKGGATPLMIAGNMGNYPCAELLVKAGADVNIVSKRLQETALICAAYKSPTKLVQLLLEKGANVNAVNQGNWTALHKAVVNGRGETARLLIKAGADVKIRTTSNGSVLGSMDFSNDDECVKTECTLLEAGASVNETDSCGRTALMNAVSRGNLKSMKLLLQRDANINLRDGWHNTALHASITPGRETLPTTTCR